LIASSVHRWCGPASLRTAAAQLVDNLNRYLCETLPMESFVTMVAVAVDTVTGLWK